MLEYDFNSSIGYWICMTSQALERSMNEQLAPLGITHRQFQVLAWLACAGDLSQADLAERMKVEAPTLAGILERMERSGWIERCSVPGDRRKKLVRPTPRSAPIWSEIVACMMRVRARATRGLSPEQVQLARQYLAQMCDNLGGPAESFAPTESPQPPRAKRRGEAARPRRKVVRKRRVSLSQ
jgi:MarR family transcriptional regulator for hemolysin